MRRSPRQRNITKLRRGKSWFFKRVCKISWETESGNGVCTVSREGLQTCRRILKKTRMNELRQSSRNMCNHSIMYASVRICMLELRPTSFQSKRGVQVGWLSSGVVATVYTRRGAAMLTFLVLRTLYVARRVGWGSKSKDLLLYVNAGNGDM